MREREGALSGPHQTANGAKAAEIPSCPLLAPLNAQVSEFPHGLLYFCPVGALLGTRSKGWNFWKIRRIRLVERWN